MNNPSFILTDSSVTIVTGGKPYTMTSSNSSFNEVKNRIANEDFNNIEELFDTGKAVGTFTKGNIVVKDNAVLYKGENVDNHVVDRILDFMRQGLPYKPLVNFLDKLMANPSRRAVQELYKFLEHKSMPLTPDGNFLAYKSVRSDWTDHHTGTVDNQVGAEIPRMERNLVCDDASIGCSKGYHVGSLEYAKSFGGTGSRLLIVEVNPADVVSVPHDCNCQKLRCSFYKIVGTFERPLDESLNTQYTPAEEDQSDDEESVDTNSYKMGYGYGWEDAGYGLASDAQECLDEVQDGRFDDALFLQGYAEGYADHVAPEPSCQKGCPCKTTKQSPKRDKFGRFC